MGMMTHLGTGIVAIGLIVGSLTAQAQSSNLKLTRPIQIKTPLQLTPQTTPKYTPMIPSPAGPTLTPITACPSDPTQAPRALVEKLCEKIEASVPGDPLASRDTCHSRLMSDPGKRLWDEFGEYRSILMDQMAQRIRSGNITVNHSMFCGCLDILDRLPNSVYSTNFTSDYLNIENVIPEDSLCSHVFQNVPIPRAEVVPGPSGYCLHFDFACDCQNPEAEVTRTNQFVGAPFGARTFCVSNTQVETLIPNNGVDICMAENWNAGTTCTISYTCTETCTP